MNVKNAMKYSVFFGLLLVSFGVYAMSLTEVGRVCLFSAISGTITLDGKPVANARLVRTGDRDGPKVDEATTDENGYFEFSPMYERTITKFLPQEFVASQKILVHHGGKEYKIWSGVKRKKEENVESRGVPLVVTCELNQEQNLKIVEGSPIHSLCSWDAEDDPIIDWEKEGFFTK